MRKYPYLLFFCLNSTLIFLLFAFSLYNLLPTSPIKPENSRNRVMLQMMPQGWGFFSKSPRDETLFVYEIANSTEIHWPHNQASNLFGLKRTGRSQGVELGMVTAALDENDWIQCEQGLKNCSIKKLKNESIQVQNPTPEPLVCGEYILEQRSPIPWAWVNYTDEDTYPTKIVKVNVQCSKN